MLLVLFGSLRGTLDRNRTPDVMRTSALGMLVRPSAVSHSDIAYCFRPLFIMRCRCGNVSVAGEMQGRTRVGCTVTPRRPEHGHLRVACAKIRRDSFEDLLCQTGSTLLQRWLTGGARDVGSIAFQDRFPGRTSRHGYEWGGEGRVKDGGKDRRTASEKRGKGDLDSRGKCSVMLGT